MDIGAFEIVLFVILGIMFGTIATLTFLKLKKSGNGEETKQIIEDCLEDLISILSVSIHILNTNKTDFKDEAEYYDELNKMVVTNFKQFLKENEILPNYIINSISDELFYTMIDKATEILEQRLKAASLEETTEILEDEPKIEEPVTEETKTDISGTLDNFYE